MKPIGQQVVVITGGSSGIGRATAHAAAETGAKVAIVARGEEALEATASEIRRAGGAILALPCDVSDPEQVRRVAERVVTEWGGIDTWVNAAAVSVYGEFADIPDAEFRRVIEIDLVGVANGMRAAIREMRAQPGGGTIVNVSSGLGDRAVPLQSAYCAAKHAVNGLSESVRTELEHGRLPIRVSVIKPASIDTPFFRHAKSRMAVAPKPFPPVYSPSLVADAILYAATHRVRELPVGGASAALTVLEKISPRLLDFQLGLIGYPAQQGDTIDPDEMPDNLWTGSVGTGSIEGVYGGRKVSLYSWLRLTPVGRAGTIAGAALAGCAVSRRLARRKPDQPDVIAQRSFGSRTVVADQPRRQVVEEV